jgi:hypothetical protein
MKPNVAISKERTVRMDAELWHTSYCLLQAGKENPLGSDHQFRASLVFTAFALEAYLNHIGGLEFKSWESLERKLSPENKLTLLCEHLGIVTDFSRRPWQTVGEILGFRNALAHGRSKPLTEFRQVSSDHYEPELHKILQADWEKFGTETNAARTREDVLAIGELLSTKSKAPSAFPFMFGLQSATAGVVEPKGKGA